MNLKEIKELIDLVTEKGIAEFELERAGSRLKIIRDTGKPELRYAVPTTATTVASHPLSPVSQPQTSPSAQEEQASPGASTEPAEGVYIVRSPMVGTFYAAPEQGTPTFVKVGDHVQPGQVLCIIEAMKLMNEIETEQGGEIVKCHVENGQPVEYGQPLFDLRLSNTGVKRA